MLSPRRSLLVPVATAILAVPTIVQVTAQSSGFVSFVAPDGQRGTEPRSINRNGVVAGVYTDASLVSHGFLRLPNGQITEFDPPGLIYTTADSINSSGQIVGSAAEGPITNLIFHGYLRTRDGQFARIDIPGATSTSANAINDSGEIVGSFADSRGAAHAYLRAANGKLSVFNAPSPIGVFPNAINANGDVTGAWFDSRHVYHGFIREASTGTFISFDAPGAGNMDSAGTQGVSINSAGEISGVVQGNDFINHGFIRDSSGTVTTFDMPGSTQTYANAIDDNGAIVGAWYSGCCVYGLYERDAFGNFSALDAPVTDIFPVSVSNGRITGWYNFSSAGFIRQY